MLNFCRMYWKILTAFVVCLILAGFLTPGIRSRFEYTKYVPIQLVFEKDYKLIKNPSLLTQEHTEAMIKILSSYREDYKVVSGDLYIKRTLQSDKDLLQNYTFKAEAYADNGLAGPVIRSRVESLSP